MKLSLVISSLSRGGAERNLVALANHWQEKGHDVTLLTLDDGRVKPSYALRSEVVWKPLALQEQSRNLWEALRNNRRRVRALKTALSRENPAVVVSFMHETNVLTLLAVRGLRVPTIVAERVDPSRHPVGSAWRGLRWWFYRSADAVVVQTDAVRERYPRAVQKKVHVVPNPVFPVGDSTNDASRPELSRVIIGMGRLTRQKGFDRLLSAFAEIAERHPDWRVVIWGEGPERVALERLRDRLGLSAHVAFPGATATPETELRRAGLFVLTSRYEGFPNVLAEAMALGLPVVSFDCPSGPRELIRDAVDGLLVAEGDVTGLAGALERLMSSAEERQRLGRRAREVVERFSLQRAMTLWDRLTEDIASGASR